MVVSALDRLNTEPRPFTRDAVPKETDGGGAGSVSTHVAGALGAARQLKMYVDNVLAELLQIHTRPGA